MESSVLPDSRRDSRTTTGAPARFAFRAEGQLEGVRLDAAVCQFAPEISRSQARRLIESGRVLVDGRPVRPAHRLRPGEQVEGEPLPSPALELRPEAIPLRVVHEDEDLIVIDKPPDLVVHPAPGHASGTLVHALLHHCGELSGVGDALRPGIVHRLDRGTSGLLVAAKSDAAHRELAEQFRAHSVERQYLALVRGVPRAEQGEIDAPIGRAHADPKRFTTRSLGRTRTALTRWAVERRFSECALLRVWPRTGRTHQIRVHLASMGLPIAGDPVYGGGRRAQLFPGLDRQALHAAVLGFVHPREGRKLLFESPLPPDLQRVVAALR